MPPSNWPTIAAAAIGGAIAYYCAWFQVPPPSTWTDVTTVACIIILTLSAVYVWVRGCGVDVIRGGCGCVCMVSVGVVCVLGECVRESVCWMGVLGECGCVSVCAGCVRA